MIVRAVGIAIRIDVEHSVREGLPGDRAEYSPDGYRGIRRQITQLAWRAGLSLRAIEPAHAERIKSKGSTTCRPRVDPSARDRILAGGDRGIDGGGVTDDEQPRRVRSAHGNVDVGPHFQRHLANIIYRIAVTGSVHREHGLSIDGRIGHEFVPHRGETLIDLIATRERPSAAPALRREEFARPARGAVAVAEAQQLQGRRQLDRGGHVLRRIHALVSTLNPASPVTPSSVPKKPPMFAATSIVRFA